MTFTWYILTQPRGHTQLQLQAGHMLTPSLSPGYGVAGRERHIPVVSGDSFAIWTQSQDSESHSNIKK